MSDTTALEFAKVNASECLGNVILLHMNRESCNADEVIEKMKKAVPNVNVCVAEPGMELELRNPGECPF